MIDYENRLLAYIDILGWSQACKNIEDSQRLLDVIQIIHRFGDTHNEFERRAQLAREKDGHTKSNWIHLQVQAAVFSDCIAISMPQRFGSSILNVAAEISRGLLTVGFLCRGGIVSGQLYHHDNLIFGPALIRAAELEKQASLPVILCAPEVVVQVRKELCAEEHLCLMIDPRGREVVDPFFLSVEFSDWVDQSTAIPEMMGFKAILRSFQEAATTPLDQRASEKWKYSKKMMISSLRRYGDVTHLMIEKLESI